MGAIGNFFGGIVRGVGSIFKGVARGVGGIIRGATRALGGGGLGGVLGTIAGGPLGGLIGGTLGGTVIDRKPLGLSLATAGLSTLAGEALSKGISNISSALSNTIAKGSALGSGLLGPGNIISKGLDLGVKGLAKVALNEGISRAVATGLTHTALNSAQKMLTPKLPALEYDTGPIDSSFTRSQQMPSFSELLANASSETRIAVEKDPAPESVANPKETLNKIINGESRFGDVAVTPALNISPTTTPVLNISPAEGMEAIVEQPLPSLQVAYERPHRIRDTSVNFYNKDKFKESIKKIQKRKSLQKAVESLMREREMERAGLL
jgi:hypothetical protein